MPQGALDFVREHRAAAAFIVKNCGPKAVRRA
jgi:hypothetical protein